MDCKEFRSQVAALSETEEGSKIFEEHLGSCTSCQRWVGEQNDEFRRELKAIERAEGISFLSVLGEHNN